MERLLNDLCSAYLPFISNVLDLNVIGIINQYLGTNFVAIKINSENDRYTEITLKENNYYSQVK